MVDVAHTRSKDPARIRILSLDGGGIYGLTGAIWLRRLCEANPRFLDGTDIDLFAGCSSGAINALLLARHERPRDALLAGELEKFWMGPLPFANTRPLRAFASVFGLAGWFSDVDLLRALRDQVGDLELGQLPHHVHISSYNWTGSSGNPRTSRAGQGATRHWRPKFFTNILGDDEDFRFPVAEIAYGAATPPMFRPLRNGIGDGASFNGNPTVSAIAQVVRSYAIEPDGSLRVRRTRADAHGHAHSAEHVGGILERIAVISLGSGQVLPYYAFGDVDLGQMFSILPSNPFTGVFWPPATYMLDAATEEAEFITMRLIGHHRALRFNPATIPMPTIVASLVSRNPLAREWMFRQIYEATSSPGTAKAIEAAVEFMSAPEGWNRGATK